MRKLLTILVLLTVSYHFIFSQTATAPSVGDGSETDPFQISSLENLYWLSQNPTHWDKHFLQTDTIDASATSSWNDGAGWSAIGTEATLFTGVYDGGGVVIENIFVNRASADYQGFFGRISDAVVKNILLLNADINGQTVVGGLVSWGTNSRIENSGVTGDVTGMMLAGGLIGLADNTEVLDCFSDGVVISDNSYAGGLAGELRNGCVIHNSYSLSSVDVAGGISGGLVGANNASTIRYCYSAGSVNGIGTTIGGMIGSGSGGTVENSFWDTESTGQGSSNGGTGKVTADMQWLNNYTSATWDFKNQGTEEIWNIGNSRNNGYPYLDWQYPDDPADDPPVIVTGEVTDILTSSATVGFQVHNVGTPRASEHGVCFNISGNPTLDDQVVQLGEVTATGTFSASVSGLNTNQTYFLKTFITNANGTNYGQEVTFTVPLAGSGEELDPYLVTNINDLLWLAENPSEWGKFFRQTSDINASETVNWNDGQGWIPVGTSSTPFSGHYNGNGYVIDSLFINRENSDYLGFLGFVSGGNVSSLGLTNVDITGDSRLGGLAGEIGNEAEIVKCFTTGQITGTSGVGGLVGYVEENSSISNCYSRVNKDGDGGGLVASHRNSLISNCYSAGNSGGLVSFNDNALVDSSFWDTDTSGAMESSGGTGKPTSDMTNIYTFANASWDFKGMGAVGLWNIGNERNDGYPYLAWQYPADEGPQNVMATVNSLDFSITSESSVLIEANIPNVGNPNAIEHGICWNTSGSPVYDVDNRTQEGTVSSIGDFSSEMTGLQKDVMYYTRPYVVNDAGVAYGQEFSIMIATEPQGDGTEDNPYQIEQLSHLYWLSQNPTHWDKHFLQTANIDASETRTWDNGAGWQPVGNNDTWFSGKYNGGGYIIDGLHINRPEEDKIGLFGYVRDCISIENIGVTSLDITGKEYVGGLGGYVSQLNSDVVIKNCYTTGNISAFENAGGLIGYGHLITISNCYSRANVTVSNNFGPVGGLLGSNNSGTVLNAYCTGSVQGGDFGAGGLIGWNTSLSTLENIFWDTETSGITESEHGTGKTTSEMTSSLTFTSIATDGLDEAWDFMDNPNDDNREEDHWGINAGVNDGYPFLKWQYYPVVNTLAVSNLTFNSGFSGGEILSDGNSPVTERGIVWSTETYPTIDTNQGQLVDGGSGTGEFSLEMTGLAPGTGYYLRAYAINDNGISYGQHVFFITSPPSGQGTEVSPYLISNLGNLLWVAQNPQAWDAYFEQTEDIFAFETSDWYLGRGWMPIGNENEPFTGTYDGKGFSVSDLYIDRPGEDFMGLFGHASGATIKDLNVLNVNVNGGTDVGGLLGSMTNAGLIDSCSVEGEVSGQSNVGGLAGSIYEGTVINSSHGAVVVNGTGNNTGGLVGRNDASTLYRCFSNSQVTGNKYVGGLVGFNENSGALVSQSYSEGTVIGDYEVGGLVGRNNSHVEVVNCYSVSSVSGRSRVGGLTGAIDWYTNVSNSYSAGHVSATESQAGGFAGGSYSSTINNCFWDIQTSGQEGSSAGTGLSSAAMKTLSTFTDVTWDFKGQGTEEIWNIGNERNSGYPYFDWQYPADVADDPPSVATLTYSDISENSAIIECEIVNIGNPAATQHGVCWNTSGSPTVSDDTTQEGAVTATGTYVSNMTGLSVNSDYFVRAYAINDNGISYGNEIYFSTAQFEAAANIDPSDAGTVSGTGSYFMGEEVTLDAIPEPGYANFVNWTNAEGVISDNNEDPVGTVYTFIMDDENVSVTAHFELIDYTVSIDVLPMGSGSVTGAGTYNMNDEVTLAAEPNDGYDFVAWKQGETIGSANPDSVFTMPDENISLSANFVLRTYNLAYTAGENGTINGDINQEVDHNSSGTSVEAIPAEGHHFTGWSDGVTDNPRTDENVTSDISVTAEFAINTYNLIYTADANGTITGPNNQGVDYGASGTAVEAVPAEGYHFTGWSDGVTDNPRTDENITGNISVTAQFAINTYTLTYAAGENGILDGHLAQEVDHGTSGTAVEAIADENYHFTGWSDGVTDNPRTDTHVTGNVEVTANFAPGPYTVTYTAGNNGSISGNAQQIVAHEGSGSLVVAQPDEGYHFVQWSDGFTENYRTDENVTESFSVTAEFAINTYTLTYWANTNGEVTGELNQEIEHGASGTQVEAVPNEGFYFTGWNDGGTENPRVDKNVTQNIQARADFALKSYSLTYTAGENGSLTGETEQYVSHFNSGTSIEAVPDEGYHFTRWSDGVTNNPRQDYSVTADISVTAEFTINTYTLSYIAGENGSINGETTQEVTHGSMGATVEAMANEGYRFVEWSDGSTDNPRTDVNVTGDMEVTAVFEQATSIQKTDAGDISIYPNPVKDVLYFVNVEPGQVFQLSNVNGELMMKGVITNGKIDVSDLKSGVYILFIHNQIFKVVVN